MFYTNRTHMTRFHSKGERKVFCINHSTNCPWAWGTAENNKGFLTRGKSAGTHKIVDDKETWQVADYSWSVPAVGGNPWRGFQPKSWLKDRIKNSNSISWEMCLGWDRDNTVIVERTAADMGYVLVTYGLEIGSVVRHHDAVGKYCPFFGQLYMTPKEWLAFYKNPSGSGYWNQGAEDAIFYLFKLRVQYWQYYHLLRCGKITKEQYDKKLSSVGMTKWVCEKDPYGNWRTKPWVWPDYPIHGIERAYTLTPAEK